VRDLVLHDDDIVVGTHGRSFWILDDYSPIRQLDATVTNASAHLFRPKLTYRFRRDKWTETPLPPEEPQGKNPPDGAIIYYSLSAAAKEPVRLEILDATGKLVRAYSSNDSVPAIDPELNVPTYWVRPPQILSAAPGAHRFVWDLHYPPPSVLSYDYPISAIFGDTPRYPLGPSALPGTYTVKLTVDGKSYTQPLVLRMDPRVQITAEGLRQQFDLSIAAAEGIRKDFAALTEVRALRARSPSAAIDSVAAQIEGGGGRSGGRGANAATLTGVNGELAGLLDTFEGADAVPTTQAEAALHETLARLDTLLVRWNSLRGRAQ
jgi:hypothetical protein